MAMQPEIPDAYEAVLADLRAKRDHLDNLIAGLEAARSGAAAPAGSINVASGPGTGSAGSSVSGPGAFLGLSITDATKKLLAARMKPMSNAEIAQELKAGGMMMSAADPNNTIGSVITRRANQVGDIVRVDRGIWGLREWYPTRQFPTKAAPKPGEPAKPASPTAPEQPSTPPENAPQESK